MDELEQFEYLSLVAAVQREMQNFIGMDDKTLAEFLISMHDESKDLKDFKAKLSESGSDFPESLVSSIDRLVLTLHPKYKKKTKATVMSGAGKANGNAEAELTEAERKQRKLFPGLAVPDTEWKPSFESDQSAGKIAVDGLVDDLMAELEGAQSRIKAAAGQAAAATYPDEPSRKRRRSPDYDEPVRHRNGDSNSRGRDRQSRQSQIDERPILYKVYSGRVNNIRDFGAFVQLEGVAGRVEGMVHISAIQANARVNDIRDLLSKNQPVKVKVMSVAGSRISLSMKDVDQATGRDLTPHLRIKSEAELAEEASQKFATGSNGSMLGGGRYGAPEKKIYADDNRSSARRYTSPERWEIKQLIASGAASAKDYPNLDMEDGSFSNPNDVEADQDIDIEVKEEEAPFLSGHAKRALDISPVRIIKAPDGTLNRAAMAGASLAKERRELSQQAANEEADANTADLSSAWQDPMTKPHERQFAADLRGQQPNKRIQQEEAWKSNNNKPITFGKITDMSITEQRKSLPIFQYREALVQAVRDVSRSHLEADL